MALGRRARAAGNVRCRASGGGDGAAAAGVGAGGAVTADTTPNRGSDWRQYASVICVMVAVFLHLLGFTVTGQGLPLARFKAQFEVLRQHIAHVRAQLEHHRDTSTG
jgi:hypothetical protein